MRERLRLSEQEIEFYKPLISLYLKYGSVDRVFTTLKHNTGVSYPHFHRILHDWGIIKSTGPQSHLSEAIYFLTALAKEKLPLESLYRTMPASLQISAVTLHRILGYVKRGLTRRHATALLVSPKSDPSKILIGRDISTPRPEIGKSYGSLSLPMTYSKGHESADDSILRVLQQEVFATLSVERRLPRELISPETKPVITIDIADVRVKTYRLIVPDNLTPCFDSYKLDQLSTVPLQDVAKSEFIGSPFRAGVPEIANAFQKLESGESERSPHIDSTLNQQLILLPSYA